jgi:hypothetical protein
MGKYEVVSTTREHVEELIGTMREADREEIWAASHRTPKQALESVFQMRGTKTGLANEEVVCIFGVVELSLLGSRGSPWLLGADAITKYARPFLRRNKAYLEEMKKRFIFMENWVDARNTEAIRWLEWLGFEIEEARPYGLDQLPFHHFTMRI